MQSVVNMKNKLRGTNVADASEIHPGSLQNCCHAEAQIPNDSKMGDIKETPYHPALLSVLLECGVSTRKDAH